MQSNFANARQLIWSHGCELAGRSDGIALAALGLGTWYRAIKSVMALAVPTTVWPLFLLKIGLHLNGQLRESEQARGPVKLSVMVHFDRVIIGRNNDCAACQSTLTNRLAKRQPAPVRTSVSL